MLKRASGLSLTASDFDSAMRSNAACITDNFWVRREGEELTWEDVKFRDDRYYRMALASDNSVFQGKPSRTPELTNIGSREKGWRLVDGTWWLYKNQPASENEAELLTCRIGKLLGVDMAHYEMDGEYIRTRNFTEGRANLQHADALVYEHDGIAAEDVRYNYEVFRTLGLEAAYLNILFLDAIVNNPDRHTKNYGILTSQEDGRVLGMAPNYDNNMAFYGGSAVNRMLLAEFRELAAECGYDFPEVSGEFERELQQMAPRYAEEILGNIRSLQK